MSNATGLRIVLGLLPRRRPGAGGALMCVDGDLAVRPDAARRRDRLAAVCVVHASCSVDLYGSSKMVFLASAEGDDAPHRIVG